MILNRVSIILIVKSCSGYSAHPHCGQEKYFNKYKHKMKQTVKIILNTLFFLVVGAVIVTLFTARFPILGTRSYVVLTGSMEPKIHIGSVVFVAPQKSYKVGDLITFKRGNITVTHRIHAIKGEKFQTKGDANNAADPELVTKLAVIRKDVVVIPYLGKFTNFLRTVPGFIIFLGIPVLIYIVLEGITLKKEWEKEIEKKIIARMQTAQVV